ncbi:MAG: DUF3782 domain-containing protein [Synechococcaceae cyanobacterium RL_1_2]|nr:DUF3782 domain-containing protein [Synechococcaceae cyanobacterium RL_1_2]
MSDPITIQDIYNLFERSEQKFDRLFTEAEQERLKSKEELDRLMVEAEQKRVKSQEDFDRRMVKLEATIERTNQQIAGLSSRWGEFVENLVRPGLERLFQARGIDVKETHPNVTSNRPNVSMEVDILAINGKELVVVEVKSNLTQAEVDEFLRKLPRFKQAFPAYANYTVYGAVAGIKVTKEVSRYAYKKGLFVIVQAGEIVRLANDSKFQPHSW